MKKYAAVVAVVALFLAPCASAATRAQQLEVKSGWELTVHNFDGKPLAGAKLTVFDGAGKEVRTVTTDVKGKCSLEKLEAGAYRVVVADRAQMSFAVNPKAQVERVTVVLPRPDYAAGGPKKAIALPILLTFILGAIAVAAAGAVIYDEVTDDDDDDKKYP
jgi:hypothetical protein